MKTVKQQREKIFTLERIKVIEMVKKIIVMRRKMKQKVVLDKEV